MKQDFRRPDKLEVFRRVVNFEAKLYCDVDEAYDLEKAADFLQQLSKSRKMSPDDVIITMVRSVEGTIDRQLRMYVLRFLDLMKIPHSPKEIKERWGELSQEVKNEVVDCIINYINKYKKQN